MKILGLEIRNSKTQLEFRSLYDLVNGSYNSSMLYGSYSSYSGSKALTLAACYRAVNLISDAIASLQMKLYEVDNEGYKTEATNNILYSILGFEPNINMSRFTFFKLIITAILLRGNAYIKINRDANFNTTSLEFINPDLVIPVMVNKETKYSVNGLKGYINQSDIIHVMNQPQVNTSTGVVEGVSTIYYAANSLDLAYNSEAHAAQFFKGGANVAAFLSSAATLTPKQEADLVAKFKSNSNPDTGNPNGIVFMGGAGAITLQTLGISPRDSQLLETRSFNVLDIARFFNVNPILLFDNTKGTYNNIENAQLDFLNTSLLPIIEKLENEFSRKLILPSKRAMLEIRFDLSNLLRADMNSQATYYTSLFSIGVVNANQIAKSLNLPKVVGEGGDRYCISTNLQDSNNLIVNQNNSIDNKLK